MTVSKRRARITGTGSYVPPDRMTNADFERLVDTSDEWITTRTGIKERRIAKNGMTTSDMAVKACKNAMEMAGCSHDEIEALITGTVTPDYKLPSNSCVIQEKMGLPQAVGFDIAAACTGFVSGLSIAQAFVESGKYRKILVVGVEKLSSFTNYEDRSTCVLFGDAAGAAVVEPCETGAGVISTFLRSDGNYRPLLWSEIGGCKYPYVPGEDPSGRDKILMNGSDLFKVAVREMGNAAVKVIEDAGLTSSDIALFIPHQANIRIIKAMAKRLKMDMSKVVHNIDRYGNTSSASIPLALDEANRAGRIKPGDHIVMVAFGGGLIWGSALLKW
ncbi:MAG: ketoacyl-ACP synthase III [Candidatus Zixiibacteriota bacterium]|nr:MAG: ketoacyl-ACP synthase III [candidate division Zixibacteria bacterium]